MKYIRIKVKAEVRDNLWGTVDEETWEKYLNGEITTEALYENHFEEDYADNCDYTIKEIENIREDDAI